VTQLDVFLDYLIQNWALILVLLAFVVMLIITVFLDKKTIIRMYVLIAVVFALSISVFFEFHLADLIQMTNVSIVLVAIRYSTIPIIISLILFALVKRTQWYVTIPALLLTVINVVSIFTGIVFSIDAEGNLRREVLGYLPYVGVGACCAFLIYILIKQSNRQASEIIPIIFLAFSFATGLLFPFIIGKEYSKIFFTTVAIALFVYYVFLILQLTKKDELTGVLNRQAFYSTAHNNNKDITGVISIDINGLKKINDTLGHLAGDEAIIAVSSCFTKATKFKQSVYRIGGDEFIILCKKTSEEDLLKIISDIKKMVFSTRYSISIGYSFRSDETKDFDEMIKDSDLMMYEDKAAYYKQKEIKEEQEVKTVEV
jgi:diguanylate cyclase (GGDEF)-like protein